MSEKDARGRQIIDKVVSVISATYWFHTNVVGEWLWWLRWMVWYVCPESDMARLSSS